MNYTDLFAPEDRERIFRFFAVFSRLEYTLKRTGYVRAGRYGEAEADWGSLARALGGSLPRRSDSPYDAARDLLLADPPKRLALVAGKLVWTPNPRRPNEDETTHLLRVVKDVRNNLFHGGKFPLPDGAIGEVARDRHLIDAATVVLEAYLAADENLERVFDEAA